MTTFRQLILSQLVSKLFSHFKYTLLFNFFEHRLSFSVAPFCVAIEKTDGRNVIGQREVSSLEKLNWGEHLDFVILIHQAVISLQTKVK